MKRVHFIPTVETISAMAEKKRLTNITALVAWTSTVGTRKVIKAKWKKVWKNKQCTYKSKIERKVKQDRRHNFCLRRPTGQSREVLLSADFTRWQMTISGNLLCVMRVVELFKSRKEYVI
ncbi:hypothetical protein XENOCAPTIV_006547 [Xenoophorus captivus]|uniref:Uncharacterized protein n=1 Tax=Xenoophorus captivus TaxID=1517983 RepID=A0ABV0RP44_9TELE